MALDVVRPQTRHASTRSRHSSSLGARFVTVCHDARGETKASTSCTRTLAPRLRSWRTACSGAGPDSNRVALRRATQLLDRLGRVRRGDDDVGLGPRRDRVGNLGVTSPPIATTPPKALSGSHSRARS